MPDVDEILKDLYVFISLHICPGLKALHFTYRLIFALGTGTQWHIKMLHEMPNGPFNRSN